MVYSITFQLTPECARNRAAQVRAAAGILNCSVDDISGIRILRRSLDARSRSPKVVLKAEIYVGESAPALYEPVIFPPVTGKKTAVIVGSGPAGLFAALELIRHNIRPIVLERGKDVTSRRFDLKKINRDGICHPDSNYCSARAGPVLTVTASFTPGPPSGAMSGRSWPCWCSTGPPRTSWRTPPPYRFKPAAKNHHRHPENPPVLRW